MATKTKSIIPAADLPMKRWNVFMPPNYLYALEQLGVLRGMTSADLVRRAVRRELRTAGFRVD